MVYRQGCQIYASFQCLFGLRFEVSSAKLERSYRRAPRGAQSKNDDPAGICHLCVAGMPGSGLEWEDPYQTLKKCLLVKLFNFLVWLCRVFGFEGIVCSKCEWFVCVCVSGCCMRMFAVHLGKWHDGAWRMLWLCSILTLGNQRRPSQSFSWSTRPLMGRQHFIGQTSGIQFTLGLQNIFWGAACPLFKKPYRGHQYQLGLRSWGRIMRSFAGTTNCNDTFQSLMNGSSTYLGTRNPLVHGTKLHVLQICANFCNTCLWSTKTLFWLWMMIGQSLWTLCLHNTSLHLILNRFTLAMPCFKLRLYIDGLFEWRV